MFVPAGITPRKSFIINSLWCYNWACRAGTGGMFLTLITSKDYLAGWACRYQWILIGYAKFCVSILRILSWYITLFYSYCISYKNPALAWGLFKFFNVIKHSHTSLLSDFVLQTLLIWKVVKVFVVPRLKIESALIKKAQEGIDPVEKNAAENLKNLLLVIFDVNFVVILIVKKNLFPFHELIWNFINESI